MVSSQWRRFRSDLREWSKTSGLSPSCCRTHRSQRNKSRRLAGFGVALALGLMGLFALAAPLVASFFHEPSLRPIVIVLSVTFLIDALQIVPRALLQKDLQFRALAIVNLIQVCAASTALVISADAGLGAWSLVANNLAGALAALSLIVRMRPYALALPRHVASLLRPLLSGWRVLIAHASWYGYSNADSALVGRLSLGKSEAGIYSMALVLANLPAQEIASIVGRVVPASYTRSQEDRTQLRRYYLLLTEGLSYLTLPIATGLALTAETVVAILFGPQWAEAANPLRILCAYVVFHAMQMLAPHVIMWTGHFRAVMWLNLFALSVMPPAFLFGIQWGLEGVAWAWVIAYPVAMLPGMVLCNRLLQIGWLQFFAPMVPAAIGCAAMAVVVWLTDRATMEDWRGRNHNSPRTLRLVVQPMWRCWRSRFAAA